MINTKNMKRIAILIILALTVGFGLGLQAQDRRTLETKVADILTQMPTHDLKHRDRLMNDMLSLGEVGLAQFVDMLVAPGTGDDTQARFALGNLSHFVGQPGQDEGRDLLSKVFGTALKADYDREVKAFLIYHLDFFGNEEVCESLGVFLSDERLYEPAVKAIVSNGSHHMAHILMEALPKLKGEQLARAIYGIGELAEPHALEAMAAFENSADSEVQKAVIYAYSRMGSPTSMKYMMNAAKEANYMYDMSEATPALITYANSLAEAGELESCEKVCATLIKKCTGEAQITYALAAIRTLVDQFGYHAMDHLINGFKSPDKKYRGGILVSAMQIEDIGATRDWMEIYPGLPSESQAELIEFFGNRNDLTALPLVLDGLFGTAPDIKKPSMVALGKLIGPEAIPYVLFVMAKAGEDEVAVAKSVLNTLVGPNEMDLVGNEFEKQGTNGKIALLELIADRNAEAYFDLVRKYTGDEDGKLRDAAFMALPAVSTEGNMKALISMLYNAKESGEISKVQEALVAASETIEGDQTKAVLDAYTGATKMQERFLPIFPKLGGDEALKVVHSAFSNGNKEIKTVAFEALTQWVDYKASSALFEICQSGNQEYKSKAFNGFVRQIASAPIPDDQRLLLLRKVMPFASNSEEEIKVIRALGNNKTFLTLIYLGSLMEKDALANEAGRAVATIALPPSGTKEGMYGVEVSRILKKAIQSIKGEESDYIIANIESWLAQMPQEDGYVSMFNGKDLSGWQGLVKNPIARAKMSEKELAKEQAIADARVPEMWTVKNGEIQFTGTGFENLCSIKEYADFEMVVDWRITKKGDSGIYLRGTPQVQIWDTSRIEVGAQVGSGGLYNNQKNPSKPLLVADNPINDWNTFYIKMIGDSVTVMLNGQLVVDNVILENYWDRTLPIFASGPIELQAHGTDLAFRDVYVKEIKSGEYNLSVQEKSDGFVSLFNGKNLDGWIGNKTDYVVEEGIIVIRPQDGGHGNLYTEKQYADFNYRFEFQLTPGANNGLGIRTPAEGDAAYVGMELQILDNTAPIYANLQPYQYHGSVYGVIPAKRGFLKPVGEWNSEEVIVQGTRIKIILNGEVIVDGDIADARDNGTMDHKDHPGLKNEKGHIGFLGHGSVVKFRNIRIKEL